MSAGRKYDNGKLRWDLVPPQAIEAVVAVITYGASKYDDDNWRKVPNGRRRYFAALMRHAWSYARGEKCDDESGLPHLAHVGACVLFLLSPLEGDVAECPAGVNADATDLASTQKNT